MAASVAVNGSGRNNLYGQEEIWVGESGGRRGILGPESSEFSRRFFRSQTWDAPKPWKIV
jgi:hypothetical protein